ncbi:hypothetical protein Rhal01_03711 [Rubritalea halochordaticola]|uniref:Uncharacterized protein n=1 Tax=Rubritalea halochordaticola TaxID=714537 RepID=A0ABP9V637_9BACT
MSRLMKYTCVRAAFLGTLLLLYYLLAVSSRGPQLAASYEALVGPVFCLLFIAVLLLTEYMYRRK